MTPMLILLFGVKAPSAISSDLVAAVLMRPVGAAVHLRKGTVNLRLVGWMALGSVPMAFLGCLPAAPARQHSSARQTHVEQALGAALLAGAAAMVHPLRPGRARPAQDRSGRAAGPGGQAAADRRDRHARRRDRGPDLGRVRLADDRLAAVPLPDDQREQLVGTDLTQAVPLTLAAALGALVFGHVEFGVTASIVIGSVPAVLIGSLLSSRAPDKYIRPIITFVIFASGLKYVGVATTALGWIAGHHPGRGLADVDLADAAAAPSGRGRRRRAGAGRRGRVPPDRSLTG